MRLNALPVRCARPSSEGYGAAPPPPILRWRRRWARDEAGKLFTETEEGYRVVDSGRVHSRGYYPLILALLHAQKISEHTSVDAAKRACEKHLLRQRRAAAKGGEV